MSKLSTINVRVDKNIKEESKKILANLGLNMSIAIDLYLRQIIMSNKIPFEIIQDEPTLDTLEAMKEAITISENSEKGHLSINDLCKELEK